MHAIPYAIDQIHNEIPNEVLEFAFLTDDVKRVLTPTTLDTMITMEVIDKIVLRDCNVLGGEMMTVNLAKARREVVDLYNYVFYIPKELTKGRRITRVLSVSYGDGAMLGSLNMSPLTGNAMLDAASRVMASLSPIPYIETARVRLIGDNTVLVWDNIAVPTITYLRCWIENDHHMSNLSSAASMAFAEMVILATKRYIYNKSVVKMGKGVIHAGSELGVIKEIIDEYRDAAEQYKTYKTETWPKVIRMNDPTSMNRHIRRMMPF